MICQACKDQNHEQCNYKGCFCQHKKDAHVIRAEKKDE